MCDKNLLLELSKERIYDEVKKILLKSPSPSVAFILLKKLNALKYLHPLDRVSAHDFSFIIQALDRMKNFTIQTERTNIFLFLAVLCYTFTKEELEIFITSLTNKNNLADNIYTLTNTKFKNSYSDSELLFLATKVNIELFLMFCQIIYLSVEKEVFAQLKKRAVKLNVLNKKQEALLRGRDLLLLGLTPSKKYSEILSLAYDKQLKLELTSYKEAFKWLKSYLL